MQETWVRSLDPEDPLEKEMATHSIILAGKSHGQRSLAGYSPWGHKELDTTEILSSNKLAHAQQNWRELTLILTFPFKGGPCTGLADREDCQPRSHLKTTFKLRGNYQTRMRRRHLKETADPMLFQACIPITLISTHIRAYEPNVFHNLMQS